jgi:uncharacterized protein YuzE
MNFRIEHYDDGEVIYMAIDPDGAWAHSQFPADTVTVDFDADDRVIGIEVVGAEKPSLIENLVEVLVPAEQVPAVLAAIGGERD